MYCSWKTIGKKLFAKIFDLVHRYYFVYSARVNPQSILSTDFELPFTIIITSYNNASYCRANLDSVIQQNYTNYTVIYINDCSTDKTQQYVDDFFQRDRCRGWKLLNNITRHGKLANLYTIIHTLNPDEFIVELDGDDVLANSQVLSFINYQLQKDQAEFLYGNYQNFGQLPDTLGHHWAPTPSLVHIYKLYRLYPWIYSGLRVFKASLFQQIHRQELIWHKTDHFFPVCHDLAYTYAMLEKAHRISWIALPLLLRRITPCNDKKNYDAATIHAIRCQITGI